MHELVSIIVPVYNVKEYLEKCVCSIINQTYDKLQIILIDDGSTDGSSELCDSLSERDGRIQVIHKDNGGVTSARKAGIAKAQGEYTLCVDSDDWIEEEMVEGLLNTAIENEADIVTSGYYREYDGTTAVITDFLDEDIYVGKQKKEVFYSRMIYDGSVGKPGILGYLWNKLIKTSLVKEILTRIDNCIVFGEDITAVFACCVKADRIVVTHNVYYHYRMRNTSAIHSVNDNYFSIINHSYLFLKDIFDESDYRNILLKQLDTNLVVQVLNGINYFMGLQKDIGIPYYDFRKDILDVGAKVILYGAGRVGQSYYKQIKADKLYELVGWVDRDYFKYQEQGMNVQPISNIQNMEYDYLILAFKYEDMAKKIKNILITEYGVDEQKILWLEPVNILDKYCFEG